MRSTTINLAGDRRDVIRAHLATDDSEPGVIFVDQGPNLDVLILSGHEARKLADALLKLADAADMELAEWKLWRAYASSSLQNVLVE